jgi:hypothetical protein
MNIARALLVAVLSSISAVALAAGPGKVNCKKAEMVKLGMTEKQVTGLLGKPYAVELAKGYATYRWGEASRFGKPPPGMEGFTVQFDTLKDRLADAKVTFFAGLCDGKPLVSLTGEQLAAIQLQQLKAKVGNRIVSRISFEQSDYYLAYASDVSSKKWRFLEYIPESQNLLRWKQMLSIHAHFDGSTPQQRYEAEEQKEKAKGNPYFHLLYRAEDGNEIIIAEPILGSEFIEYQVTRWLLGNGQTRAFTTSNRWYFADGGLNRDQFIEREMKQDEARAQALKALETIEPPDLGAEGAMLFTINGKEDGAVWVNPQGQ